MTLYGTLTIPDTSMIYLEDDQKLTVNELIILGELNGYGTVWTTCEIMVGYPAETINLLCAISVPIVNAPDSAVRLGYGQDKNVVEDVTVTTKDPNVALYYLVYDGDGNLVSDGSGETISISTTGIPIGEYRLAYYAIDYTGQMSAYVYRGLFVYDSTISIRTAKSQVQSITEFYAVTQVR